MVNVDTKWEMGSNLAQNLGLFGMDAFIEKLRQLHPILAVEVGKKAIWAAAEVFRSEIESRTPVGGTYTYQYNGRTVTVKDPHPGQARASVIIYERKARRNELYEDVRAVLVGYEKRKGFYMYWREYGSRKQAAKPIVRPAFDARVQEALAVAENVIREATEKTLQGMAA